MGVPGRLGFIHGLIPAYADGGWTRVDGLTLQKHCQWPVPTGTIQVTPGHTLDSAENVTACFALTTSTPHHATCDSLTSTSSNFSACHSGLTDRVRHTQMINLMMHHADSCIMPSAPGHSGIRRGSIYVGPLELFFCDQGRYTLSIRSGFLHMWSLT